MTSLDILKNCEWNEFFTMVKHIGPELNDRKNRFDKADLLESGLCAASKGRLKWVDEIGYDVIDPFTGKKYEVKSSAFCLYTEKRGNIKNSTKQIKLTNTLKSGYKQFETRADDLIIIDTGNEKSFSAAIIAIGTVADRYLIEKDDGFACQIPLSELGFACVPSDLCLQNKQTMVQSYAAHKKELQNKYISNFFK